MGTAKSGDRDVGVGEVFAECAGKTGFPGSGFLRQSGNRALRGRSQLPKERTELR